MSEKILQVKNLKTQYLMPRGVVKAVDGISFTIEKGEALGLAGESGCGKSTVALSILGLVSPPGRVVGGEVWFDGKNLLALSEEEMNKIRGSKISAVFQDPMSSLNPVFKIRTQLVDPMIYHKVAKTKGEALKTLSDLLQVIQIPDPKRFLEDYPHQLSGGMRQRAMITMGLSCNPKLLIADEPTSALDAVTQLQFLRLLATIKKKMGLSMLIISHNLYLLKETCSKIGIMYMGDLVEYGDTKIVFRRPKHPYTRGLLDSIPRLAPVKRFKTIEGEIPHQEIRGCPFHPRCKLAKPVCREKKPLPQKIGRGYFVSCHMAGET